MRNTSVATKAVALLLFATLAATVEDDLDRLFKWVHDHSGCPPENPITKRAQRCVQKFLCSNKTTSSSTAIGSADRKPCIDDVLQCCYEQDILPEPVCGKRNPEGIGFSIISTDNKRECHYGEFPWMVGVLEKGSADVDKMPISYRCGASLIHPEVVLTAAQCVYGKSSAQLMVRAGALAWNEIYGHQDRNVSEIVPHSKFSTKSLHNDIALLFLDTPVTLTENVQTLCLPPPEFKFDLQRCVLTGWGNNVKDGTFQIFLKKIELSIISVEQCKISLESQFDLHPSSICAGGGGEQEVGACKGDEGSPLVCPIQGSYQHYYQAGIVSWSNNKFGDKPGVYTSVAHYRNWIDLEMQKHQLDISSYTS